jgi:hypothetical protein
VIFCVNVNFYEFALWIFALDFVRIIFGFNRICVLDFVKRLCADLIGLPLDFVKMLWIYNGSFLDCGSSGPHLLQWIIWTVDLLHIYAQHLDLPIYI